MKIGSTSGDQLWVVESNWDSIPVSSMWFVSKKWKCKRSNSCNKCMNTPFLVPSMGFPRNHRVKSGWVRCRLHQRDYSGASRGKNSYAEHCKSICQYKLVFCFCSAWALDWSDKNSAVGSASAYINVLVLQKGLVMYRCLWGKQEAVAMECREDLIWQSWKTCDAVLTVFVSVCLGFQGRPERKQHVI